MRGNERRKVLMIGKCTNVTIIILSRRTGDKQVGKDYIYISSIIGSDEEIKNTKIRK